MMSARFLCVCFLLGLLALEKLQAKRKTSIEKDHEDTDDEGTTPMPVHGEVTRKARKVNFVELKVIAHPALLLKYATEKSAYLSDLLKPINAAVRDQCLAKWGPELNKKKKDA